jgi:hypothetical protein
VRQAAGPEPSAVVAEAAGGGTAAAVDDGEAAAAGADVAAHIRFADAAGIQRQSEIEESIRPGLDQMMILPAKAFGDWPLELGVYRTWTEWKPEERECQSQFEEIERIR